MFSVQCSAREKIGPRGQVEMLTKMKDQLVAELNALEANSNRET